MKACQERSVHCQKKGRCVIFGQGDLWLCPDCLKVGSPPETAAQSTTEAAAQQSDTQAAPQPVAKVTIAPGLFF